MSNYDFIINIIAKEYSKRFDYFNESNLELIVEETHNILNWSYDVNDKIKIWKLAVDKVSQLINS